MVLREKVLKEQFEHARLNSDPLLYGLEDSFSYNCHLNEV